MKIIKIPRVSKTLLPDFRAAEDQHGNDQINVSTRPDVQLMFAHVEQIRFVDNRKKTNWILKRSPEESYENLGES